MISPQRMAQATSAAPQKRIEADRDEGTSRITKGRVFLTVLLCSWILLGFLILGALHTLFAPASFQLSSPPGFRAWLPFAAIGFCAQLVDGALGMGFGVISSALLLSQGIPPIAATAGIHTVESVVSGTSAISHVARKNVNWRLFALLLAPGIAGGAVGTVLLFHTAPDTARIWILIYLMFVGVLLLARSIFGRIREREARAVGLVAFVGGVADASGGGGWGPIVTSTLLVKWVQPRRVIGTVNAVEFFLSATIAILFYAFTGTEYLTLATLGLMAGGIVAAPLASTVTRRLPSRPLLALVGALLLVVGGLSLMTA